MPDTMAPVAHRTVAALLLRAVRTARASIVTPAL
jgi:hypothetical protein